MTEAMPASHTDSSVRSQARLAGLLDLVIIVCGIGGDLLVRQPILAGGPDGVAERLLAAERAFRLSILADVAMVLADVALGALLFVLLARIDRTLSLLALAFRLGQAAVLSANLVQLQQALTLAGLPELGDRERLVQNALEAHAAGYDLGLFLFAVNCLLVAVLLVRGRALPALIGVGVGIAGVIYLIGSTLRFAAPELGEAFAAAYLIPAVAELALCVWLLARGLVLPSAGISQALR